MDQSIGNYMGVTLASVLLMNLLGNLSDGTPGRWYWINPGNSFKTLSMNLVSIKQFKICHCC